MEVFRKLPHVRIVICALIFLSVLGCEKERPKTQMPPSLAGDEVLAVTTLLSTIEAREKPEGFDPSSGNNSPLVVVFNDRGRGVAYVARKEGTLHIVHNGKAGRLVAAVDQLSISPDGKRIAYSSQIEGKWRMVLDDKVGVLSDEVNDPVFSPDSRHVAYQARIAEKWHMVVDDTMSPGCLSYLGNPQFSADSTKIVYVEKNDDKGQMQLIVSDLAFKTQSKKKFTGGQLIANADKTRIAAVKITGKKQSVIEFSFDRPDAVKEPLYYEAVSRLVFGSDGVSLAYVAERGGTRLLVLNGKEERLIDGDLTSPPVVRPDNKGVGALMSVKGGTSCIRRFFTTAQRGINTTRLLIWSIARTVLCMPIALGKEIIGLLWRTARRDRCLTGWLRRCSAPMGNSSFTGRERMVSALLWLRMQAVRPSGGIRLMSRYFRWFSPLTGSRSPMG